jgi:hypothetical protein
MTTAAPPVAILLIRNRKINAKGGMDVVDQD